MDKYFEILNIAAKGNCHNQRYFSDVCGISLGRTNTIIRELEEKGWLIKQDGVYAVTGKGQDYLEETTRSRLGKRLAGTLSSSSPSCAVILIAGECKALSVPVGLLPIEGKPLIELMTRQLAEAGIRKMILVIGAGAEQYRNWAKTSPIPLTLVENSHYRWSGTMASLACAADELTEDFLLVEGNQIFEDAALDKLMQDKSYGSVLLTMPQGSGDEAYVELEEDSIFRISKDIRQMNRIDGEMIGLCKIGYPLFQKMLEYYAKNENPYLNYEYALEAIGRVFRIHGIMTDDLAWTVIESPELYYKAENRIWPKIKKRRRLTKEQSAKELFCQVLGIDQKDIMEFHPSGGMTNTNFYVRTPDTACILRVPGAGTDLMIDRRTEGRNSSLASLAGINVETMYFNENSGIKITRYVPCAVTLTGKTARLENNIKKTAGILRKLHTSNLPLEGQFSVKTEYEKYREKIREFQGVWYPELLKVLPAFAPLCRRLETLGIQSCPCHNDLVAENLILDKNGRMYLIDWEYSGMNDPMWDLAGHFCECEFEESEQELFLLYYFGQNADAISREKILIYRILIDILWSTWTVLKECKGEDFGSYGPDRAKRAIQTLKAYETIYGKSIEEERKYHE